MTWRYVAEHEAYRDLSATGEVKVVLRGQGLVVALQGCGRGTLMVKVIAAGSTTQVRGSRLGRGGRIG